MTADRYSLDELPGVIEELRSICDGEIRHNQVCESAGIPMVTLTAKTVDRLLATLEAMAADAERYRWLRFNRLEFWTPTDHGPAHWKIGVDAVPNGTFDEAVDAARREGCDGNP